MKIKNLNDIIDNILYSKYIQYIVPSLYFVIASILTFFRFPKQDENLYLKGVMIITESLRNMSFIENPVDSGLHGFIFNFILSLIFLISGENIYIATYYNIILGSISLLISFKIFEEIFHNKLWSFFACVLILTSYRVVFLAPTYLKDVHTIFSIVLLLYFIIVTKKYWHVSLALLLVLNSKSYLFFIVSIPLIIWILNQSIYLDNFKKWIKLKYFIYRLITVFLPSFIWLYLMFFTPIVPYDYNIARILGFNANSKSLIMTLINPDRSTKEMKGSQNLQTMSNPLDSIFNERYQLNNELENPRKKRISSNQKIRIPDSNKLASLQSVPKSKYIDHNSDNINVNKENSNKQKTNELNLQNQKNLVFKSVNRQNGKKFEENNILKKIAKNNNSEKLKGPQLASNTSSRSGSGQEMVYLNRPPQSAIPSRSSSFGDIKDNDGQLVASNRNISKDLASLRERNPENLETRVRSVKELPDVQQIKIKKEIAEFLNISSHHEEFVDMSLDSLELMLLSSTPEVRQEYLKLLNEIRSSKPKIASLNTRQNDENFSKTSLRQFAETVLLGEAPKSVKESSAQNIPSRNNNTISKPTNASSNELKNRESGIEESKTLVRNIKENTTPSLNTSKREVLTNEQRTPNSDLSRKTNSDNLINTKTPSELKSKGISELLAERERELATSKREGTLSDTRIQTDISDTRRGILSSLTTKYDAQVEVSKSPKLAEVTPAKELSSSGLGVRSSDIATSSSVSRTAQNITGTVGRESVATGTKSTPQSIKERVALLTQSGRDSRTGEESVSGDLSSGKGISSSLSTREISGTSSKGLSELLIEREIELATSKREGNNVINNVINNVSDSRVQSDISNTRTGIISPDTKSRNVTLSEVEVSKSPKLAVVTPAKELSPSGLGVRSSDITTSSSVSRTAQNVTDTVGRESGTTGTKSTPQSIKDNEVSLTQSGRDSRTGEESVSGTIAGSGKSISGTTTSRESSVTGSSKGISELLAERKRELATSKREGNNVTDNVSVPRIHTEISDTRTGIISPDTKSRNVKLSPSTSLRVNLEEVSKSPRLAVVKPNKELAQKVINPLNKDISTNKFTNNNITQTKENSSKILRIKENNSKSEQKLNNIKVKETSNIIVNSDSIVNKKLEDLTLLADKIIKNEKTEGTKILSSRKFIVNKSESSNLQEHLKINKLKPVIFDKKILNSPDNLAKIVKLLDDDEITKSYNIAKKQSNSNDLQRVFSNRIDEINIQRIKKESKNEIQYDDIIIVKNINSIYEIEVTEIRKERIGNINIEEINEQQVIAYDEESEMESSSDEVYRVDQVIKGLERNKLISERITMRELIKYYFVKFINYIIMYFNKIISFRTFTFISIPIFIIVMSMISSIMIFRKRKENKPLYLNLVFPIVLLWFFLFIYIVLESSARYIMPIIPFTSLFTIYFLKEFHLKPKIVFIALLISIPVSITTLIYEPNNVVIKSIATSVFYIVLFPMVFNISVNIKKKLSHLFIVLFSIFSLTTAIYAFFKSPSGQGYHYLREGDRIDDYKKIAKSLNPDTRYSLSGLLDYNLINFINKETRYIDWIQYAHKPILDDFFYNNYEFDYYKMPFALVHDYNTFSINWVANNDVDKIAVFIITNNLSNSYRKRTNVYFLNNRHHWTPSNLPSWLSIDTIIPLNNGEFYIFDINKELFY